MSPALRYAALLAISPENQTVTTTKFDKAVLSRMWCWTISCRRYLYQGARAAFRNGRVQRGAAHPRLPTGADDFRLRRRKRPVPR